MPQSPMLGSWGKAVFIAVGFSVLGIYGTASLGLILALGPGEFVIVFGPKILALGLILFALGSPAIILALVYWRPRRHMLVKRSAAAAPPPMPANAVGEPMTTGILGRQSLRQHLSFWAQVVFLEIGLIVLGSWHTLRDVSLVPMAVALGLTLIGFVVATGRMLVRRRHVN